MKHSEGIEKSKMTPQVSADPPPKPWRAAESQGMTSPYPHGVGGVVWTPVTIRGSISDNITTGGPIRRLKVDTDGQGHHPSDANDARHLDPIASTGNASKSPI
jgi:hypothetical protein